MEYDGEKWDVAQVVSVSGVWVLLFWRSHCSRHQYWPLLIAMFGRVLLHQFLNATKGELQLAKSFYTLSVVDCKVGT